jgi:hypothetical protein
MLTKYFIFWNDSTKVRIWILKMEVKSSNPHTCNFGYLAYLNLKSPK